MDKKKSKSQAPRRTPAGTTHDEGNDNSLAPNFEYRCGRCKLVHGWPPGRKISELPTTADLGKKHLWTRCPDDGPDREFYLVDPLDPAHCRKRCTYKSGPRTIRLCTRMVAFASQGTTDECSTYGPALTRQQLACEWIVDALRKRKRPPTLPDLAMLWPLTSEGAHPDEGRIHHTEEGRWCVNTFVDREFTDWGHRILKEANSIGSREYRDWFDLLVRLGAADRGASDPFDAQRKATLYVPIDLRSSMDEQWDATYPWLRQVQEYVLRSVGRKRARQVGREVLGRDAYCYFLNTSQGKSASDIAKVVFPSDKHPAAASKVRKILSRFRKRLQLEGLSTTRDN